MVDKLSSSFIIAKGPACLDDEILSRANEELLFGIELKCCVRREDLAEEKIGLLVGNIVGKRNGIRHGNVYICLFREQRQQYFGIFLKKGLFYILSCGRQKKGQKRHKKNNDITHKKILAQIDRPVKPVIPDCS